MGKENKEFVNKELSLSKKSLVELMEKVHDKRGDFKFKAKGVSMFPSIQHDDITTLSPLGEFSVGPGEVVAYRIPEINDLMIHRVLKIKNGRYTIRGDNSKYSHENILLKDILAVVTKVERDGKQIFWPGRYNSSLLNKSFLHLYLFKFKILRVSKRIRNKFFLLQ